MTINVKTILAGMVVGVSLFVISILLVNNSSLTNNYNENIQEQQETEEKRKEAIYLEAKEYYNNKEYSYAYQKFDYIRDYKDVNEILNNDAYFKLFGNKYKIITDDFILISINFSMTTNVIITYINPLGDASMYGPCQIIDNQIYFEKDDKYGATDFYITQVNDDSIVIKFDDTYTLYKE